MLNRSETTVITLSSDQDGFQVVVPPNNRAVALTVGGAEVSLPQEALARLRDFITAVLAELADPTFTELTQGEDSNA